MAQFRLSVALASRSAGRSVVAMAAYRAGSRLRDERYGRVHDYTRRRGVAYAGIVLPDNAPAWASDREQLWNRVEERETRQNAQLGREVQLSLPHELDAEPRRALALEFARYIADTYGFAVDVAIHAPSEYGDDRNHHAHFLLTSRALDAGQKTGWARRKDRRFDAIAMQRARSRNAVEELRAVWERMQNEALAKADVRDTNGLLVQVDRRSYARQGLSITPTLHRGPEMTAVAKRTAAAEKVGAIKRRSTAPLEDADQDAGNRSSQAELDRSWIGHQRRRGSFLRTRHTGSRTHHTAEDVRAFNLSLLEPGLKVGVGLGSPRNHDRNSEDARATRLLNTGHQTVGLQTTDPQTANLPVETPLRASVLLKSAWRWRGLDALNQELSEPVEEERKKERGRGGDRQFTTANERQNEGPKAGRRLDTDPKQEDREPLLPESKSELKKIL